MTGGGAGRRGPAPCRSSPASPGTGCPTRASARSRPGRSADPGPQSPPRDPGYSDIYYKEGQWEHAEKRLSEAVRRLRGQPQQAVKLFQRLAEVHEKLGKLDEAYRQLVEASKMGPGHLLTKLSLGENRFRANRWREAVLHLGSLSEHPDAALYPDEVADALTHAAQAEIKLRHPERAIELYEAALTLRAGHRGALRALADLALERGENERPRATCAASPRNRPMAPSARRHSSAWATSSSSSTTGPKAWSPSARRCALRGRSRRRRAGAAAREDAEAPARRRHRRGGETSALLIDLVSDPTERSERRREAALLMAERGDVRDAAALLERALGDDPQDEAALVALCDLADRLPAAAGVALAERLARVLVTLPPRATSARPAPAGRGSGRDTASSCAPRSGAAIAAFEQVVALDDAVGGARGPRLSLSRAPRPRGSGGREPPPSPRRRHHPRRVGAGARGPLRRRGQIDRARCCHELLALLGQATPEELAFLRAHPTPELKPDDPYANATDEHDRRERLALPEATQMSEIFSCLWEGAPGLIGQRLEDFGVSARDKVSPMSEMDLGKIYGQVAKALGNKKTALYVKPESPGNGHGVTIVVQAPPALVVGPGLASDAPPAESASSWPRHRADPPRIHPGGGRAPQAVHVAVRERAQGVPPAPLAATRRHRRRRRRTGGQAEEERPLQGLEAARRPVPGAGRDVLELAALAHGGPPRRQPHRLAALRRARDRRRIFSSGRAGRSATATQPTPDEMRQLAQTHEPLRELLRFAISEDYFLLREKLGTAIIGTGPIRLTAGLARRRVYSVSRQAVGGESARSAMVFSSRRASSVLMSFWKATSSRMPPAVKRDELHRRRRFLISESSMCVDRSLTE